MRGFCEFFRNSANLSVQNVVELNLIQITWRYPSGQEFNRRKKGKTSSYARNGISFLEMKDAGVKTARLDIYSSNSGKTAEKIDFLQIFVRS